ncbi:MAG: SMP-30/gluconolactonase/LRE family protein, partial [Lentisphaeria bacterium]|nr:SMP-30/gluconolactonase/LRE family protein [Lentisphaeria bacterium]
MKSQTAVDGEEVTVGESPVWHPDEKLMYWADIASGHLFRYDPSKGSYEKCIDSGKISGMTLMRDGRLLFVGQGCSLTAWRDGEFETVFDGIPGEIGANDCCADPEGRVFMGAFPLSDEDENQIRPGKLVRVDPDGHYEVLDEDNNGPNGVRISGDEKSLYVVNTAEQVVNIYDYDRSTGAINNKRIFYNAPKDGGAGVPDGMAVDAAGDLWITRCGGACVDQVNPQGELVERHMFDSNAITSCAFGGEDLDTLYVTSLGGPWRADPNIGPNGGNLFSLGPGLNGR